VPTEALAIRLWVPPFDSAIRYFFRQVDVAPLSFVTRDWTIAQVSGL